MDRFRVTWIVRVVCLVAITASNGRFARAQVANPPANAGSESAEDAKERVTAERFLELLKKRPRLGTALDKVYGYHVGRGTLDKLVSSLEKEATDNRDGNLWLIQGMVHMQRGQDALAAASLEKAETALPKEPLASYYLGKTLVLLGEVDKAAEAMRRAIERQPARADLLAIFQDLGRIYQRTGRNPEALDVWQQLEKLFPGDAQVREQIATILAEEGATEAALARFTALASTVKDRFRKVELSIRAAQLKAQLGKTDEALADLEAQLAVVNPDSWLHRDVRRRIEEVFWTSGNVDGLVAYYTKWIERHPDDVDAMMRAARVLSTQRRLPEAEKWFRDAIAKAPSTPEPRLALVEALAADDHYDQAAKEMAQLVEQVPDNPDYIVRWGELVFNDAKRSEEARRTEAGEIWRRMLQKHADDPVTVARVADLLRGSGVTDAAIEQYRAAIKLAPNEPQYREYLGEYLHQLGRKDEALATWRELAAGDRETRDNLVRLSEVLNTFHYPEEALDTIAKACDMKPTFGHRARYAELLREANRHDDALAQLDLAEPMAEDPELRELVVEERIKNFQASGQLTKRIEQTETAVAGDRAKDASQWRLLALLRDADRKFQPACEAIEKSTELEPGNVTMWETAATLQERAGRFGDAIASYRKLATLDRRFLTNYLTQIASLEMRLGNADAAIKAGEELVAAAPGNSDHYRFFADMCFRTGKPERGFDVMRRNVRANPNDQEALLYLARMLSEEFETDEAIELFWRAFDLAKDIDGKNAVIAPLTELYLRTNRFESLTDRLEIIGREQNKPRDGLLWVAAAHQAAGDLGMAKQLLERLAREDSRDTKLLEQLVSLARAEYDFESAAEYQKRLVAAAPSPEAEYLLANLLLELGEVDEAEVTWMKLSQRKGDPQALSTSIATLLSREQYQTAAKLIENAMAKQPGDWELLGSAMIAYVKLDRKADARRVAERVLAMNIPPGEPTIKTKEAIKKQSSRRGNQAFNYDPYANLGVPTRMLDLGRQIKAVFDATDNNFGPNQGMFAPSCFLDVQALAYCMSIVAADKGFDAAAFTTQYVKSALQSRAPDQLWRALFYMNWQDPTVQYSPTPNEAYEKCLQALVELEDPYAASGLIAQMVNRRRSRTANGTTKTDPLTPEQIEKAKHWSRLASKANVGVASYYDLWLASELSRAGADDEAEKLIDQYIARAKSSTNSQIAMVQAMGILINESINQKPSPQAVEKSIKLFRASLAEFSLGTSNLGLNYGQQLAVLLGQLVKHERLDDAIKAVDEILGWQARQTAGLRPGLRDRIQSTNAPLNYGKVVSGRYVQTTVTFPPVSGYLGAEAILALHGLYEACKDDPAQLTKLTQAMAMRAAEPSDDVYLRVARYLANSALAYWTDDRERAHAILDEAGKLNVDPQFLGLARSRVLYESGKVREALAIVETLRPTNQQMLVDRELAILQLVLQLGDLERAKQSAQKLFALRLDSDVELKLSELMYQLGMRDLGDRMMGRIRRRAGGNQNTLVQLMTRYVEANDKEAAGEIARQVVRRTSPRGAQNYYTPENQQHEQALRVLAQTGMLDALIQQYEGLLKRSPKSTKLLDKLAAFYEAAGRRDDAQKLRLNAVENAPEDARSLYAAGQQLARLRKHSEAADKFVAAVVKSPDLLNRSYYEMRNSFQEAKAWNRLSDAIIREGIKKFVRTYQIGDMCSELSRQRDSDALNRFLFAALSELNWAELSQIIYSISDLNFKPDEKLAKLVGDKLMAPDAAFDNLSNSAFVWSRSSNGQTNGFANGIAKIVSADDALSKQVIAAMKVRLEKPGDDLFPRVLVCLVYAQTQQFDELEKTLQPLLDKKEKNANDARAAWCVASTLSHFAKKPDLACKILEALGPDLLKEENNSGFQYTATALLAFSYEKSGRNADAHRLLVQELKTKVVDETQNQHNPGYGEYQYIDSLCDLSERFVTMGYPAEAFIAYRKAFADETMLDRAKRWGGNMESRKERLHKQIAGKRDAKTMVDILKASLRPNDGASASAQGAAAFLTEPQVEHNSLIDNRVTMPLEEFTLEIGANVALRKVVSQLLRATPLAEDRPDRTLKTLVTWLLISDAARDREQADAAASAIAAWVRSHKPPEPAAAAGESPGTPGAAEKAKKSAPKVLPEELLLGMAALRMPAEKVDRAEVASMLERAISAAKVSGETALVGSLQCQLAKNIAATEPDRARRMFQDTLNELLPADDLQGNATAPKEGK